MWLSIWQHTGANRTPLAWVTVVFVRDSQIRISIRPSVQFHRDKTKNFPHSIRTSPIKSSVKPRQWTSSSNSSLEPKQWLFFLSMRSWWVGHICLISFPVVVRIDDGTQSTLLIEFRYSKQLSRQRIVRLLQLFSEVKFLLSQTHLTDFIDTSCKKGPCWSIHYDNSISFSQNNCPASGLSICSNFSWKWGFLVSQIYLRKFVSSCSKKYLFITILINP